MNEGADSEISGISGKRGGGGSSKGRGDSLSRIGNRRSSGRSNS